MDLNKAIKVLIIFLLSTAVIFIIFLTIYIPFAVSVHEEKYSLSPQNEEIINKYNKILFIMNEAKKEKEKGEIVQARSSYESALNILKELEVQNQKLESEVRSSISNLK